MNYRTFVYSFNTVFIYWRDVVVYGCHLLKDLDILGSKLVSCGMDHSLKIWSLEKDEFKKVRMVVLFLIMNSHIAVEHLQLFKQIFVIFEMKNLRSHNHYRNSRK